MRWSLRDIAAPLRRNLNGLDFRAFRRIVSDSGLRVKRLELAGYPPAKFGSRAPILSPIYRFLRILPGCRELLGRTIVFIGENPGAHSVRAVGHYDSASAKSAT